MMRRLLEHVLVTVIPKEPSCCCGVTRVQPPAAAHFCCHTSGGPDMTKGVGEQKNLPCVHAS